MKILMVGAGATGAYFGAHLAAAGRDVTFLVCEKRAHFLTARGLRITGVEPELRLEPKLVTAGELQEPFDVVVLTVKASALDSAIVDVAPAVGPNTTIIPFLNGMAHMDALSEAFGAEKVLGSVVHLVGTINGEGDIEVLNPLARWTVGEQAAGPVGGADETLQELLSHRLGRIVDEISVPGFTAVAVPSGLGAMWEKWVFIVSAGAVTCLMRGPVGDVVQCPGGSDFVGAVLTEAAAVSAAAGFPIPGPELDRSRAFLTEPGSGFTASLYRDVSAGLAHEGEHIIGDFVRRALELGVEVPLLSLALLHLRVHDAGIARRR